jgi:hypothetical protein
MPDELQYDEKTDCSLTKTAQIIGMPLPCHQDRLHQIGRELSRKATLA